MKVKKEILVRGKKAVFTYDDTIFNENLVAINQRNIGSMASVFIKDLSINISLQVSSDEYFEVVDYYNSNIMLSNSKTLVKKIRNEVELLEIIIANSYFLNSENEFKICEKGFIAGFCDDKTSSECEYSALNRDGLCGAECPDCLGEMVALAEDKAYVCDCSKILFKYRHIQVKAM